MIGAGVPGLASSARIDPTRGDSTRASGTRSALVRRKDNDRKHRTSDLHRTCYQLDLDPCGLHPPSAHPLSRGKCTFQSTRRGRILDLVLVKSAIRQLPQEITRDTKALGERGTTTHARALLSGEFR